MKTARILIAWLLVGLPLAWGISRSVLKSMPLFRSKTIVAQSVPATPEPLQTSEKTNPTKP